MGTPRLVVGLGNPGQKYRGTRHNVGRDFIDHVAKEHREEFSSRRQAEIIRLPAFFGLDLPKPVVFARLDTFMNTSGPALQGLLDKEGAKIDETLIVVDEFMIPFGALRLRGEGSAGGHNGLKSIIETFGTLAFPRLRVGVGPLPMEGDPADFVLGRFSGAERERFPRLFDAIADAIKRAFTDDLGKAMNAVNKVHFSKKSPLLPIFLIVVVDVLGLTIIIPLLPVYAETLGASAFVASMLVSVYGLCQFIAGPILGQISDRVGRKPVLLVSQIGTFVGFLVLAFSRTLGLVFLSRIIDGLTAGNLSVAQAYISDVTEPKDRARAFGLIGIAFGLGFLVGPAVSGFLARFSYKAPIFAAAGLSATSILATFFLLPARTPAAAPAAAPARKMPMRTLLESLAKPGLGPLLWQFLLYTFSFSMFMSGFPLFAERRFVFHGKAFDVENIGYVLAFMGLMGIVIQGGLLGRMVKRFGERRMVLSGFVAMAAASALLSRIAGVPPLLLVIVALSFGISVVRPALTSLVTQAVPRTEQGVALGMTQSLMSLAQIAAPLLGGALIQRGYLAGWAAVGGAFSVLGLLVALSRAPARGQFVA